LCFLKGGFCWIFCNISPLPPLVSFVPSFLYFTMEQAWEATPFVSLLSVFFAGLMFFGSGFGKSQLCNSVSNLGLSFSVLISFFCDRTWRCWRFAIELRWCYTWEIAFSFGFTVMFFLRCIIWQLCFNFSL
jgi:hypothetical protein